jgi:hypothetical protein
VHGENLSQESRIIELLGDKQGLPGPSRGGGQRSALTLTAEIPVIGVGDNR